MKLSRVILNRGRSAIALSTGAGLLALLLWSTTFAIGRHLTEQVGPLTAGASVYLAGGVVALLQALRSKDGFAGLTLLPGKYLFGCGALFLLYTALLYSAIGLCAERTQLLEIALVNYLWPAATILLSVPLLNKRGGPLLLPGTAIALLGVWVVLGQGNHFSLSALWAHINAEPLPYVLAFVAAVSWGLYSNLARRWSGGGDLGGVAVFVPATGLVLLALRFVARESSTWRTTAAFEALALGAITSVSYACWDLAMRRGNVLLVVSCSYFLPLLSTVVSCIYLGIAPNGRLWWGCLLLIAGTIVSWRSVRDRSAVLPDNLRK